MELERKEQALKQYPKGEITITEAAKHTDTDPWTFLNYLKEESKEPHSRAVGFFTYSLLPAFLMLKRALLEYCMV